MAVTVRQSKDAVSVEGLADLRRDVRAFDKKLGYKLDNQLKKAAAPIRDQARRNYYEFYTRRRGRSPIGGITAVVTGGFVGLRLGGARYPYLLGQEWGSDRHPQFFRAADATTDGVFFWRAVQDGMADLTGEMERAVDEAVTKVAREVG